MVLDSGLSLKANSFVAKGTPGHQSRSLKAAQLPIICPDGNVLVLMAAFLVHHAPR